MGYPNVQLLRKLGHLNEMSTIYMNLNGKISYLAHHGLVGPGLVVKGQHPVRNIVKSRDILLVLDQLLAVRSLQEQRSWWFYI